MKTRTGLNLLASAALIALTLTVFNGMAPQPAAAEASIKASAPIRVYFNSVQVTTSDTGPILLNGNLMLPVNLVRYVPGITTAFDASTKTIFLNNSTHFGSLQIGQRNGLVNLRPAAFRSEARLLNGRAYVPARFVALAIGGALQWNSAERYAEVRYPQYVKGIGTNGFYRLDGTTGQLYGMVNGQREQLVGQTIAKLELGYVPLTHMRVDRIGEDSELLTITNDHGEPLINTEVYSLFVHQGRIVYQMHAHYWRFTPQNVTVAGKLAVMTDGHLLQLVDDDGTIVKSYSLSKLTGLDDSFAVERIQDRYLLVRSEQEGLLSIIDLKAGKSAVLYAALGIDPKHLGFGYDGISFQNDDGNRVHFTFKDGSTGQTTAYAYELSE